MIIAASLSRLFEVGTGSADSRRAARDAFGITAALSPPLSAPRPLGDSAASVRDAFGITAALSPVLWPPCLLGAQCRNVSSAYGRDRALSQLSIGIDITDGNGVGIAAIPQKSQCATGVAFSKI